MIERLPDPASAGRWCEERRRRGQRLGFVPTMGALHDGHLALVRRALSENDAVCVSVFVNPLQFDEASDLARYPRDFEGDAELLDGAGCDMVFTGTLEQFFPELPDLNGLAGTDARARALAGVDPGPGAEGLEGERRPGHFDGVAAIVARLFAVVAPDVAYFGEKDFQQTLVVRHLARAAGGPRIAVCPTEREPSGLARSSRNARLDDAARARATCLSRGLFAAREAWRAGERDPRELRATLAQELEAGGVEVEYAEVRDPERWTAGAPDAPLERAQGLVAARVGAVRLIDSLRLDG